MAAAVTLHHKRWPWNTGLFPAPKAQSSSSRGFLTDQAPGTAAATAKFISWKVHTECRPPLAKTETREGQLRCPSLGSRYVRSLRFFRQCTYATDLQTFPLFKTLGLPSPRVPPGGYAFYTQSHQQPSHRVMGCQCSWNATLTQATIATYQDCIYNTPKLRLLFHVKPPPCGELNRRNGSQPHSGLLQLEIKS